MLRPKGKRSCKNTLKENKRRKKREKEKNHGLPLKQASFRSLARPYISSSFIADFKVKLVYKKNPPQDLGIEVLLEYESLP